MIVNYYKKYRIIFIYFIKLFKEINKISLNIFINNIHLFL